VPKLRIGMDAYFTTLGSGNKRWTGKLRQILPTPTVVNNVVLYTALFDVANPGKELMTQMTAQVFFVLADAHDVVTVPVSALQYASRGAARAAAAPPTETASQGTGRAEGTGRGGGRGRGGFGGGRRGQPAEANANAGATEASFVVPRRPATVTVLHDDGSREVRDVVVGVTDRVTAEIVSGLAEGEKVIAGMEVDSDAPRGRGNGGGGRGRGPVLFGG